MKYQKNIKSSLNGDSFMTVVKLGEEDDIRDN